MFEFFRNLSISGALTAATLTYFAVKFLSRRYLSGISDVPGPFSGSFSLFWIILQIFKKHTERAVINQHKKHGIFVRISHNEVSISDPRAIREVLQSNMDKASWYQIFSLPDSQHVNTMSETDHKEMVRRTKNVAAGYSLSNILKGEQYIDQAIALFQTQIDKLIESGKNVELNKWINYLAFDIVGEATFSRSFGFLAEGRDIGDSIRNQYTLRLYIAIIGYFYWLHDFLLGNPLIAYFKLQPSMHIFDSCLAAVSARSGVVDALADNKIDESRADMISEWQKQYRSHPERMEEKEILSAAVANMGAGADTVSCILQACFYYLLRDRESFQLLRAELDQAKLSPIPSYEEVRDLPFLGACIKESYRIHTPVGFGMPRVCPKEGITVCGRYFPPGIILSVSPWVIHRQESVFGKNVEDFDAQRWIGEPEKVKQMDACLIAYGSGYGTCPGKNLAHLEILKTAALVVRDFDWEQVVPGQEWTFETYFTAVPHSWPLKMRRRNKDA